MEWIINGKMASHLRKKHGITNLPKKLQKQATKLIHKIAKENRHHFKMDGWDLDVDYMVSELINDLLGTSDIMVGLKLELAKASKVNLVYYGKCESALSKTPKKEQRHVYYNEKTNKLILKKQLISPGKSHMLFLGHL